MLKFDRQPLRNSLNDNILFYSFYYEWCILNSPSWNCLISGQAIYIISHADPTMVSVKEPENLYDFSPLRLAERKGSCRLSNKDGKKRRNDVQQCDVREHEILWNWTRDWPFLDVAILAKTEMWLWCQKLIPYEYVIDPFSLAWIVKFFSSEISPVLWILRKHKRWNAAFFREYYKWFSM